MKGYCEKNGIRIGFGEVSNKILAAKSFRFTEKEEASYEAV